MRLRRFFFICSSVMGLAACKPSKETQINNFIAHNCAQYPIDLYLAEKDRGVKIYQFGAQDERFRRLVATLWQSFRANGTDITGEAKLELVNRYLPRYFRTCQQFFQPLQSNCRESTVPSPQFSQCLRPYHRNYQRQIQALVLRSGEEPVDLERISLSTVSLNKP